MNYIYDPSWNFHNAKPITVRVGKPVAGMMGRPVYLISKSQARRIEKHFCGITDCRCNSGGIGEENAEGTVFSIPAPHK